MERTSVKHYLRTAMNGVISIDSALSQGASLNEFEWFDFIVKAEMLEYVSYNVHRYWYFNKEDCLIAKLYQKALCDSIDITVCGYSNRVAIKIMRNLLRGVNHFVSHGDRIGGWFHRIKMTHWDENGVLKFQFVRAGEDTVWLEKHVRNVSDLIEAINDLVVYGVMDNYEEDCSISYAEYLNNYIKDELRKIENSEPATPFVGGCYGKPLIEVLKGGNNGGNSKSAKGKIVAFR